MLYDVVIVADPADFNLESGDGWDEVHRAEAEARAMAGSDAVALGWRVLFADPGAVGGFGPGELAPVSSGVRGGERGNRRVLGPAYRAEALRRSGESEAAGFGRVILEFLDYVRILAADPESVACRALLGSGGGGGGGVVSGAVYVGRWADVVGGGRRRRAGRPAADPAVVKGRVYLSDGTMELVDGLVDAAVGGRRNRSEVLRGLVLDGLAFRGLV